VKREAWGCDGDPIFMALVSDGRGDGIHVRRVRYGDSLVATQAPVGERRNKMPARRVRGWFEPYPSRFTHGLQSTYVTVNAMAAHDHSVLSSDMKVPESCRFTLARIV